MKRTRWGVVAVLWMILCLTAALGESAAPALSLPEAQALHVNRTINLLPLLKKGINAGKSFVWQSTDETVVTVTPKGQAKGIAQGEASVTLKDELGHQAVCRIQVVLPVRAVSMVDGAGKPLKRLPLAMDSTWPLIAQVLPADATLQAVTWQSSNERVATVDENGVVTGVGKGTATITAAAMDGSRRKGTLQVKVQPYDLVFTKKGAQTVTYAYGSGRFVIRGAVKTGNVSIPDINQAVWAVVVGGLSEQEVPVTPVSPGEDVVTITVGRKKFQYRVFVAPSAVADSEIAEP